MIRVLMALVLLAAAPVAAQNVTLNVAKPFGDTASGWTVSVGYGTFIAGDSMRVSAQRGTRTEYAPFAKYYNVKAGANYLRTYSVAKAAADVYTFRLRLYRGTAIDSAVQKMSVGIAAPAPSPPPTVTGTIIKVDTVVTTRVAGDTTFTTTRIITTRATYDTVTTVTFAVVPTIRVDSVKLTAPKLYTADTTKVTFNWYVWPHPSGAYWNVRWLINGTQVATCVTCGVTSSGASTTQLKRTAAYMSIVGCAKRSTGGNEMCSPPVTFGTAPVPADTTPAPVTVAGFVMLAMGEPTNMYKWDSTAHHWVPGTDSLIMPIWAKYNPTADTGQRLYLSVDTILRPIRLDTFQTVKLRRPAPGETVRYGLCGEAYDSVLKAYHRNCFGKLADTTQADWYRYTQPSTALPQPTTGRIVRMALSPAHAVFFTATPRAAMARGALKSTSATKSRHTGLIVAVILVVVAGIGWAVVQSHRE